MNRRRFMSAVAVGGTASVSGCIGDETDYEGSDDGGDGGSDDGGGGSGSDDDDGDADVELLEHELVREDEGTQFEQVSVEGRAENVGDSQLGYVEVRARFYNEQGDLIDSFIDNINDVGPGQTWAFEVRYPGVGEDAAEVADYDIGAGTSF